MCFSRFRRLTDRDVVVVVGVGGMNDATSRLLLKVAAAPSTAANLTEGRRIVEVLLGVMEDGISNTRTMDACGCGAESIAMS